MDFFLPVVKPEIGGSIERELVNKRDIEYIKKHLKRLDIENPTIAKFIKDFSKSTKDRVGTAFCSLLVYRMLESQAEANKMSEEYEI